jgi:hypothetical protein
MQPGETVFRSALDKPLHQLTEDDISQVTREDCRRYLKEKGLSSLSIVVASHYFLVFCRFNPCWWWCPYKKRYEKAVVEQIAGNTASDFTQNTPGSDAGD